jgi:hypothetical protein
MQKRVLEEDAKQSLIESNRDRGKLKVAGSDVGIREG